MSETHYLYCSKCGEAKEPRGIANDHGLCEYCYSQWLANELRWLKRRAK
jgi:hypothetical protein